MPLYHIFVDLKDQSVEVGDIEQEVENASHGVKLEEDRSEYGISHLIIICHVCFGQNPQSRLRN